MSPLAMMMELALSVIVDEKMFLNLYSMLSYKFIVSLNLND